MRRSLSSQPGQISMPTRRALPCDLGRLWGA
jgi:hypothetical protein